MLDFVECRWAALVRSCSRWLIVSATSCAAAPPPKPQPAPQAVAPAADTRLEDQNWGKLPLRRFAMELAVPDVKAWTIADGKGWFVATHQRTNSSLAVLSWLMPRSARPADCQAEARVRRPSLPPIPDESELLERTRVEAPPGYDSEIIVFAEPATTGAIDGYALLFGANVGRCFAAVFSTRTTGEGQEEEIARRLKIASSGIFKTVNVLAVDDRVSLPDR